MPAGPQTPYNPQSYYPGLELTMQQLSCQAPLPTILSPLDIIATHESVVILSPIIQMKKPKTREVKPFDQSHTAS